jgi:hypothetical protein
VNPTVKVDACEVVKLNCRLYFVGSSVLQFNPFTAMFFLQKNTVYPFFLYRGKGTYIFPSRTHQNVFHISEVCATAKFVIVDCMNWHVSIPSLVELDLLVQKLITHSIIIS